MVDLLGGRAPAVSLAADLDQLGEPFRIPAPVAFELWMGTVGARDPGKEAGRVLELLAEYEVVPFDGTAARRAGEVQGGASARGRPFGTIDVQVVGIALARAETLVTGDARLLTLGGGLATRPYERSPRGGGGS